MTTLDVEVVAQWLAGLRRAGVVVADTVADALTDAVQGRPPAGLDVDERLVSRYLHGIAIGIAGTQSEPPGMCLTAGLLAGAAALEPVDPQMAAAARMVGLAAADRAVEDDGLAAVVATAARATGHEPIRTVVVALAQATRAGGPAPEPANCGIGPDGTADWFPAEVSFATTAAGVELVDLRRRLALLAAEVWYWPLGDETQVHLHTDQPGACISEAFAGGLVFGLSVTPRRASGPTG